MLRKSLLLSLFALLLPLSLQAAEVAKSKTAATTAPAPATDTGEAARAKALLQKAVNYYKEKGEEALVAFGGKPD